MKINKKEAGITLVALIVTIIVLVILAAVTINIAFRNDFIGIATKGTENYAGEQVKESTMMDNMAGYLGETVSNIASVGQDIKGETPTTPEEPEKPELPVGWDAKKVYAVISADNKTVPVPKGFTVSEEAGEKSVDGGFVIKQDGTQNEFVWVPVANTNEMFGIDKDGNFLGKLYDFNTGTATANNWEETDDVMSLAVNTSYREPDVLTDTTHGDASTESSRGIDQLKTVVGIAGSSNEDILNKWKEQLEKEFKEMKESVETYGGFYIGRYETGDLSQDRAVVAKGNEDISYQNWYVQYQKSKTIVQGTGITSSMIWGCQWDATLKWFLNYEDTKGYVTNSEGGNYTGSIEKTGYHSVKNIYDMAGNVYEWIIEACNTDGRVTRRRLLQQ